MVPSSSCSGLYNPEIPQYTALKPCTVYSAQCTIHCNLIYCKLLHKAANSEQTSTPIMHNV